MACNRETSADGSTSSAPPPACQTSDALVPCCTTNCHFFGCAATLNLCSKCYSEHILKEGGVFLDKPCDTPVDSAVARLMVDGTDGANTLQIGADDTSIQRFEDASELPAMDTPSANESGLQESLMSKDASSVVRTTLMCKSMRVSDLRAIVGSVETQSSAGDVSARQQQIPSPLSLSCSGYQGAFPPLVGQVETKLSMPPLPRQQTETKLSMPPLPPQQQAVNRCLTCRKRVGLLGFKCRCGDIFCALHRYAEKHDCSFDYKAAGRAVIAKENPIVKARKIEQI